VFFIDFEGHITDDNIAAAMKEIGEKASDIKVLGAYPKAVL
jgi:chorismate mutase/prephenate dehydratase